MKSAASPRQQQGAAVMAVTALLCFVALLAIAFANRGLVAEARAAANLTRLAQAAQAAETGIEWTLALLNDTRRRGPDCLPAGGAGAVAFSERMLRLDEPGDGFIPQVWDDAGTSRPLTAACRGDGAGWTCSCPANGAAAPGPAVDANALASSFVASFSASPRPGLVRAASTGCARGDGACDSAGVADADAATRIEALFAWRPALRAEPAAALTVRGHLGSTAALALVYEPAAGGLAVHAGGSVDAGAARIATADGSPSAGSVAAGDPSLSGLDASRFFARYFGAGKARWATQPGAVHVDCSTGCGAALAAAANGGARLLFVPGGARLEGPVTLGSAAAPIVLVVDGPLQVSGAVTVVGVLEAAALDWRGAGGSVRGATLVEGDYSGSGTPELARDQAVLATLGRSAGSFARVNGSWKDF